MPKNESGLARRWQKHSTIDYDNREITISRNEEFWIEVIRHASGDTDPSPYLARVHAIRAIFRNTRINSRQ